MTKIGETEARKIKLAAHRRAFLACLLSGVHEEQVKSVGAWLRVSPRTVAVVLQGWREREKSK